MAKGQKRGNREVRKPKQEKQPKPAESTAMPDRSVAALAVNSKKKGK